MAFDLRRDALENTADRLPLFTTPRLQLVLLAVPRSIPGEVHEGSDQFFRVEAGTADFAIAEPGRAPRTVRLGEGGAIVVPAGTWHEVRNAGPFPVKLSTIYSPPHA